MSEGEAVSAIQAFMPLSVEEGVCTPHLHTVGG